MRCPNCASRLVEVERSDVLIDACPECRGVWLDRGELDRILAKERAVLAHGHPDEDFYAEMAGRPPATPPRRQAPEPTYREDERAHKKRKRKSLLEDLLDF